MLKPPDHLHFECCYIYDSAILSIIFLDILGSFHINNPLDYGANFNGTLVDPN